MAASNDQLEEQLGMGGGGNYHNLLTPYPGAKNSTYKLEMYGLHLTGFDVNSMHFYSQQQHFPVI